jgi:hypothetical protein
LTGRHVTQQTSAWQQPQAGRNSQRSPSAPILNGVARLGLALIAVLRPPRSEGRSRSTVAAMMEQTPPRLRSEWARAAMAESRSSRPPVIT